MKPIQPRIPKHDPYERKHFIPIEFIEGPCGELEIQIRNILDKQPELLRQGARDIVESDYCPRCPNYNRCLY